MSHECGKALAHRLADPHFTLHYLTGHALDVGAGPDGLAHYRTHFPGLLSVREWDLPDGDGQTLPGVAPESFDCVHSSHCLEHLRDPKAALTRWLEVVKPGGFIVVLIPDEDLYEQGVWPSTFNHDHKHTFTTSKPVSWSPKSVNVTDLIHGLDAHLKLLRQHHADYPHGMPRQDWTVGPHLCAIEFVLQRRPWR